MDPISADDPLAQSASPVADNLDRLRDLFPDAFTEGKVDFDTLRQLLGDAVETETERYGLSWHGKRRARQLALMPSRGTLRPALDESVDWDTTQNLMIEGDNLEVLKLLRKPYAGKVKLIYIDPPYNTGKDFVYKDSFQEPIRRYQEVTGQVAGGAAVTSNTESGGRFHTAWLNMMYPRLMLARDLLMNDGVLAMSVDDNELANGIKLLDELLGSDCFISQISIISNPRGRQSESVATTHEYLLLYSRNPDGATLRGNLLSEKQLSEYDKVDKDGGRYRLRGLRHRGNASRRVDRPNMFFPLYVNPESKTVSVVAADGHSEEVLPRKSTGEDGRWEWGADTVASRLDRLEGVFVSARSEWDVHQKDYLDQEGEEKRRKWISVWQEKQINYQNGSSDIKSAMGSSPFSYPKPVYLIRKLLDGIGDGNDLILDLFAGSGTTGHAVMAQNAADGGNRRYILVQLPEPLDPANKDQKAAADYCDTLGKPRTIAELTKERLRRAGEKVQADHPDATFDAGFRVYTLDTSNIQAWNPDRADLAQSLFNHVDNLAADRSEADVLAELLLKLGLDLCVPIETRTLAGQPVHAVGLGAMFACLPGDDRVIDRDAARAIAEGIADWRDALDTAGDTTAYFRDGAFADDVAKANLTAILEQRGVASVRSL